MEIPKTTVVVLRENLVQSIAADIITFGTLVGLFFANRFYFGNTAWFGVILTIMGLMYIAGWKRSNKFTSYKDAIAFLRQEQKNSPSQEVTYTKEQVAEIIKAYHAWVGEFGVPDVDGNMQEPELELSKLNTYYRATEDSEQMPFSDIVAVYFAAHIDIDEAGHPETTPFSDTLAALK